jgi:hypothetical protein
MRDFVMFDKRSWFCDKYCQGNMKPNKDEQSPLEVSAKIGKFFFFVCYVHGYLTQPYIGKFVHVCLDTNSDIMRVPGQILKNFWNKGKRNFDILRPSCLSLKPDSKVFLADMTCSYLKLSFYCLNWSHKSAFWNAVSLLSPKIASCEENSLYRDDSLKSWRTHALILFSGLATILYQSSILQFFRNRWSCTNSMNLEMPCLRWFTKPSSVCSLCLQTS